MCVYRGYKRKWRGCIEDWTEWIGSKTLDFLVIVYSAICGDHPGVHILYIYEHVHLNYEL